ncbi:MAG: peptidylprolyl isomerase [Pseudomonas sp.]|uniref:peptidylprolyl isomerase n=1 Tax=Pseudomonas sp. TaxID=306 RepID=UPI00339A1A52
MHRFKINAAMVCGLMAGMTFSAWAAEDTVLLQRGEVSITESDLKQLIDSLVPVAEQAQFMSDPARVRKMLVDNYVVEELAVEAREKGMDKLPEVVFRQQYQAKKNLAQYYLTSLLNQNQPDWEQLAKESYIANKDQYKVPEKVEAAHILIAINDQRDDAQAAKRAEEAYKKVVAGKQPFAELVKEYSDDPSSAKNKGSLGAFAKGQMVKPFEDAAFAMSKPGEISKPIKSQFGYHIIQFNGRQPAGTMTYEQVKQTLHKQAREQFAATTRENKLSEIRSAKDLNINLPAVDELTARMIKEATSKAGASAAP